MRMHVVLMGAPGAGKGTQASRIARALFLPKISTGDILRDAVRARSDLGRNIQSVVEAGRFVSDELMIAIVRERLAQPDVRRGCVLDGFPRTLPQAGALDALIPEQSRLLVLNIVVSKSVLVSRLLRRVVCIVCGVNAGVGDEETCKACGGALRQRADDNEGIIHDRLELYAREARPLVDYYRERSTFHSVCGDQGIEEVSAAMMTFVADVTGVSPFDPANAVGIDCAGDACCPT
jgi:adenylate kinase